MALFETPGELVIRIADGEPVVLSDLGIHVTAETVTKRNPPDRGIAQLTVVSKPGWLLYEEGEDGFHHFSMGEAPEPDPAALPPAELMSDG